MSAAIGAPRHEIAVREVGEAQDRIGQRHADGAETDHARRRPARRRGTGDSSCRALAAAAAEIELGHHGIVAQQSAASPSCRRDLPPAHRRGRRSPARRGRSARPARWRRRWHGSRRVVPNTASTSFGDRPADGSSSMSTRGRTINARAIASICRCPPDRLPAAMRRRRARSGNSA